MSHDNQPSLRPATANDLAAINDIYNHYVLHSTCTYQTEPETMDARQAWFAAHGPEHPVMVVEAAGQVVAWGSLSKYHRRAAYGHTVENSIYVRHDNHRRGLGAMLLADQIARARQIGHHAIIAVISSDQTASIELHRKLGFTEAGRLREIGRKFDRWLDVSYMELML